MRFDYSKIEEKALPHFKGGEKELNAKMFADGAPCAGGDCW